MTFTGRAVERAAGFLDRRVSRRSVLVRSAFAGSALLVSGKDYVLRQGTAYQSICYCGNTDCDCADTCCSGYTEFCCSINGGYNWCPTGTVMGGWWKADGSVYCNGPRYYMDCNAKCECLSGCGSGFPFCDTGCDGRNCECALGNCNQFATSCFQFRYGQCNQDVACVGRIACRVVACVAPWTFDPTCTTALAVDDYTADQNAPCWTPDPPAPPPPPVPPPPPCTSPQTRCEVVAMASTSDGRGYWVLTGFGRLFYFGDAPDFGDASHLQLGAPLVGMAPAPKDGGYWLVAADGGVFTFGSARYFGSMGGKPLGKPIVGMAAAPDGNGYWLVAADGGVFTFGSARYFGSMGGKPLGKPIVGMAAAPDGNGYWLVAADGGVFTFGSARYFGSMGGKPLGKPIVGMAAAPDGNGYWLVAADGGVFTFGSARYFGSMGGKPLGRPVVGMAAPPLPADRPGYWMVAQDGGIFSFDVQFYGSAS